MRLYKRWRSNSSLLHDHNDLEQCQLLHFLSTEHLTNLTVPSDHGTTSYRIAWLHEQSFIRIKQRLNRTSRLNQDINVIQKRCLCVLIHEVIKEKSVDDRTFRHEDFRLVLIWLALTLGCRMHFIRRHNLSLRFLQPCHSCPTFFLLHFLRMP